MLQYRRTRALVRRRTAVGAFATLAIVMTCVPAAPAEVVQRERFSDEWLQSFEMCGIVVQEEARSTHTAHLRVGKGEVESAFFAHDRFSFASTITNPANGRFVTITSTGVFLETTATRVGETTFEFHMVEAGRTFTMRDASGDIVLSDRGRMRTTIVLDTLGDETPGGEFVEFVGEDAAGPHPGYRFDDEGRFCDVVTEQLA